MEQGGSRLDDFPLNVFSVTPYTPSTADIQVSDDDKAGATLLFSGIFLGLVGITFTIMGWIKYQGVSHFEWTQLLGPILLSVGVTFILIAVCKFKMLYCQVCKESEERALDSEQTAGGQSFVFTGINQPITFHGATVVQYIPPPYGSQEPVGINAAYLQPVVNPCGLIPPGGVVTATPSPPQYYTIYPPDNATFIGEQDYSSMVAGGNDRYVVWRGDAPLLGVTVTARDFVRSRRKVLGECEVCVASSQDGGVGSETRVVGCNGSVFSAPTARSGPDADQLEETQLGEEDSTWFSPPPYEEIYSLPR